MHGRYLLDTNIIISLFADDSEVKRRLEKAEEVFVPSVAMGELYYGARKSAHLEFNLERLDEFVFRNEVLGCDVETAECYGLIKSQLWGKGSPIPENDIWIAAIAQQYELAMATRDAHFMEVAGLVVEPW